MQRCAALARHSEQPNGLTRVFLSPENRAANELVLVRAHPELAGAEAKAGTLTAHSTGEQARLGLNALSGAEFARITDLNRRYRAKFGFPCIIALRLHATRASVLAEMERRLGNDAESEMQTALAQIGHITRGRLGKVFGEG